MNRQRSLPLTDVCKCLFAVRSRRGSRILRGWRLGVFVEAIVVSVAAVFVVVVVVVVVIVGIHRTRSCSGSAQHRQSITHTSFVLIHV